MLGNDKLEDFHVHERIILKVKEEKLFLVYVMKAYMTGLLHGPGALPQDKPPVFIK
jgi:hypothetical protein